MQVSSCGREASSDLDWRNGAEQKRSQWHKSISARKQRRPHDAWSLQPNGCHHLARILAQRRHPARHPLFSTLQQLAAPPRRPHIRSRTHPKLGREAHRRKLRLFLRRQQGRPRGRLLYHKPSRRFWFRSAPRSRAFRTDHVHGHVPFSCWRSVDLFHHPGVPQVFRHRRRWCVLSQTGTVEPKLPFCRTLLIVLAFESFDTMKPTTFFIKEETRLLSLTTIGPSSTFHMSCSLNYPVQMALVQLAYSSIRPYSPIGNAGTVCPQRKVSTGNVPPTK